MGVSAIFFQIFFIPKPSTRLSSDVGSACAQRSRVREPLFLHLEGVALLGLERRALGRTLTPALELRKCCTTHGRDWLWQPIWGPTLAMDNLP